MKNIFFTFEKAAKRGLTFVLDHFIFFLLITIKYNYLQLIFKTKRSEKCYFNISIKYFFWNILILSN